jgi:molecular chaperone HscB
MGAPLEPFQDLRIDADDFALFGLPRRFALERALVDDRARALQSRVHPDRFAAQGASAQRVAMQWSVRVNEAWNRLKDPLQRAGQLCALAGVPVDADSRAAMPAEFLIQQMAWREALDEAEGLKAVSALDEKVRATEGEHLEQLRRQLDEEGAYAAAADTLRALMFLVRFRQDIARRLEALDA